MRNVIFILGLGILTSCQTTEESEKVKETVSDCHDVVVEDLFPPDTIFRDTVIIPETIIAYEIDDYYSYFFGTSINDVKNNTPEDAFNNGSFVFNEIDYQNGFLNFRTQNTPLDMDGDSDLEYGYEITYWIQSDSSRIVAFCKTEYTWVSEESELTFFLHDKNGINQFNPSYAEWTLNDFTGRDVKNHFSEEIFKNPPVYIALPQEGKEILVDLAIHGNYEPASVFETYDSLNLTSYTLLLNPITYKIKKVKSW